MKQANVFLLWNFQAKAFNFITNKDSIADFFP